MIDLSKLADDCEHEGVVIQALWSAGDETLVLLLVPGGFLTATYTGDDFVNQIHHSDLVKAVHFHNKEVGI